MSRPNLQSSGLWGPFCLQFRVRPRNQPRPCSGRGPAREVYSCCLLSRNRAGLDEDCKGQRCVFLVCCLAVTMLKAFSEH